MRNKISLNRNWRFIQENVGLPDAAAAQNTAELLKDWQQVDLPHTWNAIDGMDGNGSYYRGICWYAKMFEIPKQQPGGHVYVEILAAGQQAAVYVNGTKVAYHEGGYSAFRADITEQCKEKGENLLVIACSNEYKDSVYPQSADFTFYGGLYRGVNLILVPETHFDLDYYGGPGLKVTPKPVPSNVLRAGQGCGGATFDMESWVTNPDENFTVLYSIMDADGREVASAARPADDTKVTIYVPDVIRWDLDNPYLYTVTATLQRRNEEYDEVSARAGVRSFSVDPDKGFIINGVETPLRGVSRHQDMLYKGNALSKEDHYHDAELIKELGANTIRLAHYQHNQYFYDACDELGFAVWAEIPFISVFNADPAAHQNCISQMKELIIQNYNHPSIMFWGVSNEILIGGISEQLVENHKELNALCHQLDPTRLTAIAHVTMTPVESPIHNITDIESYNHYFGWYGGKMEDNGPWLDNFHKVHPEICLGLSEYGCEGIITYHGPNPACKDYSEEYQALYHEHMAKVLDERPWMWSSHVWNMFDFGCAARDEGGVAGRNNKGLMTIDRKTKKDSYFIYQAYWTTKPMVHVCGRRYAQRAGETTEIRVYSNQPTVALYLNGKLVEEKSAEKVFVFTVALAEGANIVLAVAGDVKDSITLDKVEKEPSIYVLPEVNERNEGVANWFKLAGDLDLTAPMEFPEGKYSIKDTVEEIAKCPEAMAAASEAFKLTMNMTLTPGEGMWDMMRSMTMEAVLEMAGSMCPKGFIQSVNAKLIKFDKM
ncbi:MAG: glycoside hydrolase family 2 protein [Lachnospiraceae bacterium]|nr:glycoside hydrolase family 2 protein [Lachnospiraceae bacterium]